MTPKLRNKLRKITPQFLRSIRSGRIVEDMKKQRELERKLYVKTQGKVIGGPFEGMVYCDEACGSMLGPKILGVYEAEIQGVISDIVASNYENIVDVGAAEGYYAVGLLRSCPKAVVTGFETSPQGRGAMESMAKQNKVAERLTIAGHCEISDLEAALKSDHKQLIICDIEGGEKHLLNAENIPLLNQSDILVEVHDFADISISSTLLNRFGATHEVERISSQTREPKDLPASEDFNVGELLLLSSERRPCVMEWFWMRSKARPQ